MADDLPVNNDANNTMFEMAVCQPDRPNQAMFLKNVEINLIDFRVSIIENGLIVPDKWVFITREGSLISQDQEQHIILTSIVQRNDNRKSMDVYLAPALTQKQENRRGNSDAMSSFATIIGAIRDIYISSIQPNLHDFIKPIMIAAALTASLSLLFTFIIALNFDAVKGVLHRSHLRQFLCGHGLSDFDIGAEFTRMQLRIEELEARMTSMKQVEIGTLECDSDTHSLHVFFKKTNFTEVPRIIFAPSSMENMGHLEFFGMDDLHITTTGFRVECSYTDRRFTKLWISWVAVGK